MNYYQSIIWLYSLRKHKCFWWVIYCEIPYISPLTSGKKINSLPGSNNSVANVTPEDKINQLLANINQQDCVLLDENLEITYVRGNITPFMMFTEGRVDVGGKSTSVQMVVKFLNESESSQSYILIFNHHPVVLDEQSGTTSEPISQQDKRRIKALEDELKESNESLQTTIEELETSNEELQSTYEEAQSTSEELYTSTEELQTSNEELQSTNEELRTVNEEIAIKNDEIEATNAKVLMMNAVLEKEIEERKQAEQSLKEQKNKLRTIIDSEPAWVNVCDDEGVIQDVNPAGVEIMEADSIDQLVGKKLLDLVAAEDKSELLSCKEELEQGEIRKHSVEVTTLKGNMRWLEISTVRLPEVLDENLQMMSIICDQTQFKEAQNKLVKRQEELSQLMRINTLGAMATGLAHELNQPLAAIGNYLSGCENLIAREGCDRDEIRNVLKLANQQLQRTGDIVRQIKGFVEQDQEQETIGERVDINDCIDNSIKMLRSTGFFKKIEVILESDKSLPPVYANHVQIEQVIINLMMNALESMEELEPDKRSLEVHSLLTDDNQVEVQIKDRGHGMSEEEKQEVFKPFHTTKEKGMGMGLCISHTIIELHTGQMTIIDRKGGGTIFSFILPIYKEKV